MTNLSAKEISFFEDNGYLLIEGAVTDVQLDAMRTQLANWIEESKSHSEAWGETIDGRARFDIEPGHNAENLALRRVNAPSDVSEAFYQAIHDSKIADCVADLIGPNIKYHHCKINSKLPGAATQVKWHQDFPFTPHSNDDLITALLMIDEVTEENGPLQVVAGSHKHDLFSLWHDGVFTGAVAAEVAENCKVKAINCIGKAGSLCLMHTRLLHGSTANFSQKPRSLFISVFSAEDAVPCAPNPVPNLHQGEVVRGVKTGWIRSTDFNIQLPQMPESASFFSQQAIV